MHQNFDNKVPKYFVEGDACKVRFPLVDFELRIRRNSRRVQENGPTFSALRGITPFPNGKFLATKIRHGRKCKKVLFAFIAGAWKS